MGNQSLQKSKQHSPKDIQLMVSNSFKMIQIVRNHWVESLKSKEMLIVSLMEKNNLDKEQYLEHGNENVEILRKIQAANQCLKIMRSMIDQLPALIKCQNDLAAFLKVKPGLNTLIWTIQKLEINQLVISLIPKIEQVATNFYLHSINQLDSVDPKHVLLFKNDSNTLQDEIGKYWINFIKRKADIQQTILFENQDQSTQNCQPQIGTANNNKVIQRQAQNIKDQLPKEALNLFESKLEIQNQNLGTQGTQSPYKKNYSAFGNGGPMNSDMFNFDDKIKNISQFSNTSQSNQSCQHSYGLSQYNDDTLPLKSHDISIIFDPEAEVVSKKIQSIFLGDDDQIPTNIEESLITAVYDGDKLVNVSKLDQSPNLKLVHYESHFVPDQNSVNTIKYSKNPYTYTGPNLNVGHQNNYTNEQTSTNLYEKTSNVVLNPFATDSAFGGMQNSSFMYNLNNEDGHNNLQDNNYQDLMDNIHADNMYEGQQYAQNDTFCNSSIFGPDKNKYIPNPFDDTFDNKAQVPRHLQVKNRQDILETHEATIVKHFCKEAQIQSAQLYKYHLMGKELGYKSSISDNKSETLQSNIYESGVAKTKEDIEIQMICKFLDSIEKKFQLRLVRLDEEVIKSNVKNLTLYDRLDYIKRSGVQY